MRRSGSFSDDNGGDGESDENVEMHILSSSHSDAHHTGASDDPTESAADSRSEPDTGVVPITVPESTSFEGPHHGLSTFDSHHVNDSSGSENGSSDDNAQSTTKLMPRGEDVDGIPPALQRFSKEFLPAGPDALVPHGAVEVSDSSVLPVTRKELFGWYFYDFANSVYYTSALGAFMPMLLLMLGNLATKCSECQILAATETCRDPLVHCGLSSNKTAEHCVTYNTTSLSYATVPLLDICSDSDFVNTAKHACKINFIVNISPASFVLVATLLSVVFQIPAFLSLGGVADFGNFRKKLLGVTAYTGAIALSVMFFISSESVYWLAGIFLIISNVLFGAAMIFYNSFLPVLVQAHPDVLKFDAEHAPFLAGVADSAVAGAAGAAATAGADTSVIVVHRSHMTADEVNEQRHVLVDKISTMISQRGFMSGYVGGLGMTAVNVGITFLLANSNTNERGIENDSWAIRLNLLLSAIWWATFTCFTIKWLQNRPSPPLPRGQSYLLINWKLSGSVLKTLKKLPHTMRFLIGFFIYMDSMQTMSNIAVVFAQDEIKMSSSETSLLFVIVQVFALFGCWIAVHIQRWFKLSSMAMIRGHLLVLILLPIYGLLGLIPGSCYGLKNKYEMYAFTMIYGLNIGSLQSYSRSVFSQLCPKNMESQFFTFFEITDRGSTLMGPIALVIIKETTGSLRLGMIYLVVMILVPIIIIWTVNFKVGLQQSQDFAKNHGEPQILSSKKKTESKIPLTSNTFDADEDQETENANL